jgi:diacylglycerol kinase (ATP)
MKMCPDARPDDGVLDICVAGDLSRLETLMLLPRVFRGAHTGHRKVRLYRTTEIRIVSRTPLHVQADGEVFGRLPAEIRIVPGALRVIGAPAVGAAT